MISKPEKRIYKDSLKHFRDTFENFKILIFFSQKIVVFLLGSMEIAFHIFDTNFSKLRFSASLEIDFKFSNSLH